MTSDEQAFLISGHRIRVFVGDLAALPVAVDGIVSSDDNYLSHAGGVSRALWQKAGHQLRDFVASNKPPLRLGDAWMSPAFELNARVLVHAVSIDLDQNRTITEAELPALYLRLFETLATAKCETVALPLLGAGAAGITPRASATAFIDALTSGLPAYTDVTGFILAIRSDADSKAIDVLRDGHERDRDIERDLAEIVSLMPGEGGDSLRKAWERYVLGDPDTRGPALALLLGHLSDLQERFPGVADDALVEHLAREGAMARNRIAHSRAGVNAHDWGTLLSAVRATLAAALQQIERGPSRPSPIASRFTVGASEEPPPFDLSSESELRAKSWSRRPAQRPLGLTFPDDTRWSSPKPSSSVPSGPIGKSETELPPARGAAPLRELRDFFITYLTPDALSAIYLRLETEGYQGVPELQLLEFLVREPDLVELVASEFGNAPLRAAILKFRGEDPPSLGTAAKLASWFLKSLGFPQPIRPSGLQAVRNAVKSAKAQLLRNNDPALRGAVAEVAQRLEYVCRVMLRFISQAAYRKAPEALFREWEKLEEEETLATAGLGKLVILVETLNSRLQRDDNPSEVQLFTRDVAKGPLFPTNASDLAKLRNSFSHYQQHQSSASVAHQAKAFLAAATRFLEYLDREDGRIFPHIVLIEGVHYDRWGRRIIEMVDDEGVREVLYTDEPIAPGETYFMHPLTNPLRVDPILVPAGDLLWLDN